MCEFWSLICSEVCTEFRIVPPIFLIAACAAFVALFFPTVIFALVTFMEAYFMSFPLKMKSDIPKKLDYTNKESHTQKDKS